MRVAKTLVLFTLMSAAVWAQAAASSLSPWMFASCAARSRATQHISFEET